MSRLKKIQAPIASELVDFQEKLRSSIQSDVSLLDRIMNYILKTKGKQIRPTLVFLCAKMLGATTDRTQNGAALVEILHTATLVHDDVIDEADRRRGFFSIQALWKGKVAVLVGDYLFSRCLLVALNNNDYESLRLFSEAVKSMSEGELLQLKKSKSLNITEADYYRIIYGKTASLLSAACAVGAASVTDDEGEIDKLKLFGEKLGMTYQMRDDLFDYGSDDVGKPLGIDIKQKKMTLPLIHALEQCSFLERRRLLKIVKSDNPSKKDLKHLQNAVQEKGGIAYATDIMLGYQKEALDILETFENSPARESLIDLVKFVVERKK